MKFSKNSPIRFAPLAASLPPEALSRSNRLKSLLARLSVFALFTAIALPAQAGIINEPDPSLGGKVPVNVKTGLRYWIELNRSGKTFRVTNQQKFITGDRIRFHVQPTVDGFAYIVLRSGSQGDQAVLFPLERLKDDNRLHREVDYGLPADDFLTFDANPGTEKVSLMFSKHVLDASKVLSASIEGANHVVLRAASQGAKDLIPAHISVLYQPSETMSITTDDGTKSTVAEAVLEAIAQDEAKSKGKTEKPAESMPLVGVKPAGEASSTTASTPNAVAAAASAKTESKVESKADQVATSSKPDAKPEVKTETKADAKPEVKAEAKPEPTPGAKPDANSDPKSQQKSTAITDSKAEQKPASKISMAQAETVKSTTGAVLVREDEPDKVLHIDVDLEHSAK